MVNTRSANYDAMAEIKDLIEMFRADKEERQREKQKQEERLEKEEQERRYQHDEERQQAILPTRCKLSLVTNLDEWRLNLDKRLQLYGRKS